MGLLHIILMAQELAHLKLHKLMIELTCFFPSDFTIQFWVFPRTNQGSYTEILTRVSHTYSGTKKVLNQHYNYLFFYKLCRHVKPTVYSESSSQIPLNEWSYVAITRETNTIKFYINGVLDATRTGFTGVTGMASDDIVYLGRGSFDASARNFDGLLNSFEFIKAEIYILQTLRHPLRLLKTPQLRANYQFRLMQAVITYN